MYVYCSTRSQQLGTPVKLIYESKVYVYINSMITSLWITQSTP